MTSAANKKNKTYSQSNIVAHIKEALKDLIIKTGCSIAAAAAKFDIDECRAEYILFSSKPTKQQTAHALEIYNKGFPLMTACVASGVSIKDFNKAKKQESLQQYKPLRW